MFLSSPRLASLFGVRIIVDPFMTEFENRRWPRSKKKRIRKKWMKRHGHQVPRKGYIIDQAHGTITAHPAEMARLKAAMKNDPRIRFE